MYAKQSIVQLHAKNADTKCFQLRWKSVNVFVRAQNGRKRMKT